MTVDRTIFFRPLFTSLLGARARKPYDERQIQSEGILRDRGNRGLTNSAYNQEIKFALWRLRISFFLTREYQNRVL